MNVLVLYYAFQSAHIRFAFDIQLADRVPFAAQFCLLDIPFQRYSSVCRYLRSLDFKVAYVLAAYYYLYLVPARSVYLRFRTVHYFKIIAVLLFQDNRDIYLYASVSAQLDLDLDFQSLARDFQFDFHRASIALVVTALPAIRALVSETYRHVVLPYFRLRQRAFALYYHQIRFIRQKVQYERYRLARVFLFVVRLRYPVYFRQRRCWRVIRCKVKLFFYSVFVLQFDIIRISVLDDCLYEIRMTRAAGSDFALPDFIARRVIYFVFQERHFLYPLHQLFAVRPVGVIVQHYPRHKRDAFPVRYQQFELIYSHRYVLVQYRPPTVVIVIVR